MGSRHDQPGGTDGLRQQRVRQCLERATDPRGEGERTFLTLWEDSALAAARALDELAAVDYSTLLDGLPVSVKDLFDVRGEVTRAAALALDDRPPATRDAPVVARLKQAGAVLVGRTNMTPFAFSVVGLNDEFGTPRNPADNTRTPGGSSSGAAVSVASGMADTAIGSDTVGSVRVPAALCGVVGFKSTQRSVPREGAVPLSASLDSIGTLATNVETCARTFAAISARPPRRLRKRREALQLALPVGKLTENLDGTVAEAFERACERLRAVGVRIIPCEFETLAEAADGELVRTLQSVEAYAWHEERLARRGAYYDDRIRERLLLGQAVTAADYTRALQRRSELIGMFAREALAFDALILPTVREVAPTLAECEADEDGVRTRLLRNTAPFNLLDGCALTLPIHQPGELPVGLMVAGPGGHDDQVLAIGATVERVLVF